MEAIPAETANGRIVQIREALQKTPAEFAEALRVSRSYIYELEKNRRRVNERIIMLAALNFGVNDEWLRTGRGRMFNDPEQENRRKIEQLFDKLCPEFQEYVLRHIDILLELQDKCKV